ncbi:helix-turn-helix domain-containing protein [Lutispora saccharofermentans]|uniref:Helix-turn-helix domain-containing protein n=1 Tax=Lutispora saccharofermentans TaxID=3024236 RepID=A0ABT1NJR6_9FIRM|nr:helix-turn-helix domain-containing protein [Lutispora saccharofermentans]MCQ1531518.1 helix-turn-helix domain-containing protein [Lutispora saccharofermentans]
MLGENIRNIRKSNNMTISELAELTGLSVGYISQLERNLIEPSLSSLRKVAKALEVPTYIFMEDDCNADVLTKMNNRLIMSFPKSPVIYELISPLPTNTFNPSMLGMFFEVKPHKADTEDFITHTSEELIIILEGEADIILGSETFNLSPGDSLYIQKSVPHKIINSKNVPIKGLSVVSPPMYPKQK